MRHLISIKDLTVKDIVAIENLYLNERIKLKKKVIATLFYERSTRTRLSFEAAALRLGSRIITETADTSSAGKGENLFDTIRTISLYADCIVLRHPDVDSMKVAREASWCPVINAGNGIDEHPTQALGDWFSLPWNLREKKRINMLMVGDLAQGRTIHSWLHLMDVLPYGFRPYLAACTGLEHPNPPADAVVLSADNIEEVLPEIDILYLTRQQTERTLQSSHYFQLTKRHLELLPQSAHILHPMPRNAELPTWADADPRAHYHTGQIWAGMIARKAILHYLLN